MQYTTDVLFRDLWLRPDLSPRDSSLMTVRALIASGQVAQIGVPHESSDGQRPDTAAGRGSYHAFGLLRRLLVPLIIFAKRSERVTCGQRDGRLILRDLRFRLVGVSALLSLIVHFGGHIVVRRAADHVGVSIVACG